MSIGPGDVVVCVDDGIDDPESPGHSLVRGRYYTVTAVEVCWDGGLGVDIAEDPAPRDAHGSIWLFAPERFRKIRPADDEFIQTVRACKPLKERRHEYVTR